LRTEHVSILLPRYPNKKLRIQIAQYGKGMENWERVGVMRSREENRLYNRGKDFLIRGKAKWQKDNNKKVWRRGTLRVGGMVELSVIL
jgi:hypothetical protein